MEEIIVKPKKTISNKINDINNKIYILQSRARKLMVKHISEYGTELIKDYICENNNNNFNNINLICKEIDDSHHSDGECKRTISFTTSANKKTIIGSYSYWYTDSTIYMSDNYSNSDSNYECNFIGLNKDVAKIFFDDIDYEINWKFFR